jgi:hypothetical protein
MLPENVDIEKSKNETEQAPQEKPRADQGPQSVKSNIGIFITAAVTLVGILVSGVQVYVVNVNNKREMEAKERETAITTAKFLNENRNQIFSSNQEDREQIACLIQASFKNDVCDRLFGKLASSATDTNRRDFWRRYLSIMQKSVQAGTTTAHASVNDKAGDEPITPQAKADPVPDSNLYNFSIWLDLSDRQKKLIRQVVYKFDHPSFKLKKQTKTDPTDGFKASYTGWGAIDSVPITVTYNDGHTANVDLEMIKALNW